jgi:hypothetical protein
MGPRVPQQARQRVCACASEVALILPSCNIKASARLPGEFEALNDDELERAVFGKPAKLLAVFVVDTHEAGYLEALCRDERLG